MMRAFGHLFLGLAVVAAVEGFRVLQADETIAPGNLKTRRSMISNGSKASAGR
jgi:hypothetical protein